VVTLATDKQWWAVYHDEYFWLTDTCAGGSWSSTVEEAEWYDTDTEAWEALTAAEIDRARVHVVRVR
jgi:hypothetical protein